MEHPESLSGCFDLVHKRINFLATLLCAACLASAVLAILVALLISRYDVSTIMNAIEASKCSCKTVRAEALGNVVNVEAEHTVTIESMARDILRKQGKVD